MQCDTKLASIQRDMRFAPLEDPTLPRGVALSRALAKELSLLFLTVSHRASFAQFAAAAAQHGLQGQGLFAPLLVVSACTSICHSDHIALDLAKVLLYLGFMYLGVEFRGIYRL